MSWEEWVAAWGLGCYMALLANRWMYLAFGKWLPRLQNWDEGVLIPRWVKRLWHG